MVFEDLKYLCEFTGKPEGFLDRLWEKLLTNSALYEEFLFYIDNHCLNDKITVEGYSLSDLYVYMLGHNNLINDTGKDTAAHNKESMVLDCFMGMAKLIENPAEFVMRLEEGEGMDLL